MSTRFVCILGMSRTGSSHLIRLLRNCGELNVKGELFHIRSVGPLTGADKAKLAQASGGKTASPKAMCEWRRRNPRQTMDVLYESGHRRPLVFKLFWDHLAKEVVADEILSRPDIGYMLLRRRPIDCYISKMKAAIVGAHEEINTTTIRPVLEPKPFIFWVRQVKDWYEWLDEEIRRRALPCFPLSFEQHIENRTAQETLFELQRRLEALGCPPISMPQTCEGRARQDREADYRRRVANWQDFEADLAASAPDLLRWALSNA